MAKELFLYIDYTVKESTKIRIYNYSNSVSYEQIVDLNSVSLFDALQDAISIYKGRLIHSFTSKYN